MLSAPSNKKLFLIDAYAIIFRAYYAFIKSPRINSKGINTSAVFGFTNAVLEIIRVEKPTHIAVVFDPPGGSFRTEIYPEYKANRDETPEDIKLSVPLIRKVLEGLQISTRMEMGYEADDLIGYLAKKAEKEGYDVYMMTPDKDFGQLVSDKIKMFRPGRGRNPAEIWGPEEVCEKFGLIRSDQFIDYLGLMGDASDNIPGVPGVGAKTAAKLLCEFDSIDGLYENTDKLKGKMKEKVEANHEVALLSRKLATIALDIDAEVNIESMVRREFDMTLLAAILEELEFRTLIRKLIPSENSISDKPQSPLVEIHTNSVGQVSLFGDSPEISTPTPASTPAPKQSVDQSPDSKTKVSFGKYHIVDTPSGRSKLITQLQKTTGWGFHIITDGFNPMLDRLLGFSFAINPGEAWYVPTGDGNSSIIEEFKSILEDQSKEITATNYKFSKKVLEMHGIKLSRNVFDCMVAHYLLDPDQTHKLENLAEIFLNYNAISLEGLVGKGKNRKSFEEIDNQVVSDYACESADLVLRLAEIFKVKIEEAGMTTLLNDVELPLISILADMELVGVRIDENMLGKYSIDLGLQIATLQSQILKEAGLDFNIDSPKQLGEILFETLVITDKAKKTKTGQYQTGEDVLKKLVDLHAIVPLVLEYRKLKKLLNTYVDPLPKLVHPKTGRIHTSYMQTVASTGRLSSKDPNLQNIPIRSEAGRQIRKAFIPSDSDHVLLGADYSQVELRVAAAMSMDPGLCEAFNKGQDVHAATAAKVFSVDIKDVTREQRTQAKAVNFGILYGQGAFGLAEELGIKRGEAKEIISSYNEQFPTLENFTKECIEQSREKEYAETILGRRRKLPGINSKNGMVKAFAERNAVNAPIQGSAADIIKVAMVKLAKELEEGDWKAKMIMQVHDELVLDVPKMELDALMPLVKKCMEEAVELKIPLIVDMKWGNDWLEAH
jgi:DNA polymerase-1